MKLNYNSHVGLKSKRSEIWKHFTIVSNGKAKCSYCKKTLSYSEGVTGNLARHIKSIHKTISIQKVVYGHRERYNISQQDQPQEVIGLADVQGPSTSSASGLFENPMELSKTLPASSSRAPDQEKISNFMRRPIPISKSKQLDEQLIRVIVKEYQPFKVVEDPDFKKFDNMLCPNCKMPERKTISNSLIPRMYISSKEVILKKLSEVDVVCLTTDGKPKFYCYHRSLY